MKFLLKNVSPAGTPGAPQKDVANILIKDHKIAYLGTDSPEADQSIDCGGCMVSPGWFDMRVFTGEPGFEHREDLASTCRAAAAGGFTGILALPNTQPVLQTKESIAYLHRSSAVYPTRIYPMGAVTQNTKGEQLTEMLDLHHAGAMAFTDGIKPIWQADIVLKTLLYLQKINGLLINRPEDTSLSRFGVMHEGIYSTMTGMKGMPALAEEMMVARDLRLLEYAGGKLHFATISTAAAVQLIREAKHKGLQVSCDIAAHQLAFDDSALLGFDANYKVNPPFRSQADIEALKAGLADGTIDAIVSDHQPHDPEGKDLEYDLAEFGITGLQTAFSVALQYSGLPLESLLEKLSAAPRRLLGLPELSIKEGSDANLTLFTTTGEWLFNENTNQSRSVNSPFMGQQLKGQVLGVFNEGKYSLADGITGLSKI
jgi:dihydroorotase